MRVQHKDAASSAPHNSWSLRIIQPIGEQNTGSSACCPDSWSIIWIESVDESAAQGCRVFCLSLRIIQPIGEQNTGSSAYCSTKQCYPVSIPETPSSRQAPHEYRIFLASHRGFPSVFCAPGGGIPRVFCAPGGSTPLVFYTSSFHCSSCSGQFACLPLPSSWLILSRPMWSWQKIIFVCCGVKRCSKLCRNLFRTWRKKTLKRFCSSYKK